MIRHRRPGPSRYYDGVEEQSDAHSDHTQLVLIVPADDVRHSLKPLHRNVLGRISIVERVDAFGSLNQEAGHLRPDQEERDASRKGSAVDQPFADKSVAIGV